MDYLFVVKRYNINVTPLPINAVYNCEIPIVVKNMLGSEIVLTSIYVDK